MLTALIITWAFWGAVIVILIFGRRSWIPVPVVPVVLSVAFWLVSLWSDAAACWGAVALHLWIAVASIVEYYRCQKPARRLKVLPPVFKNRTKGARTQKGKKLAGDESC